MRYLISILGILCLVITFGCEKTVPFAKMNGFETEVDSLIKLYHGVGAAVAVVKNGETVYTNGFGYKNLEEKTLVDAHTIFGIGSCTKAFTASLFGILEDKGKVSLTDAPVKHIPHLKFYSEEMDESIQIKHILSHSTGLPGISTESSAVFFKSENKNDIIPRLAHLQPQSSVNEEWIYNNYLYALAGRLSEHITQNSWQENLSQYIFDPLEMKSTYGNVVPASKNPNFSLGYGVSRVDTIVMQVLPENFPTRDAGGNIYSSVRDMTNWISMWLNEGKYKKKQLLPTAYTKQAMGKQQHMFTDSVSMSSRYYGYGWMNSEQEGHLKIEHSGGISGYTSNVVLFPDDDLGIVVLTNQNTSGLAFAITNNIVKRILDIETEPGPNEPFFSTVVGLEDPKTDTVLSEEAPPSHELKAFEGRYYHPGFGTILVTFEENTLYAETPFTKFRLQHQSNNEFIDYFTERKSQVVGNFLNFNFQPNADGNIDRVLLNVDIEPAAFMRQ